MGTRRNTLSTPAELARFTHDACARIRDTFYTITDAAFFTANIDARVRDALSLPTPVIGVRAIDPLTEINTS